MKLKLFMKYSFLVLLIYIYLFDPFYFPIGFGSKQFSIVLLYIVAFFYSVIKRGKYKQFTKVFKTDLGFLLVIFVLSLLITLNGGSFSLFGNQIKMYFANFLVPILIINYAFWIGINDEDQFMRLLLVVGTVASIGTMICLLSPSIGNTYKLSVINLEQGSFLTDGFRGFGFSTRLTSDYGFIEGAMLALGVYYGKKNKWFYLFFLFAFFAVIFNARTGIIVAAIGIVFALLLQTRKIIYTLMVGILVVLFVANIEPLMYSFMDAVGFDAKAMNWISEFFADLTTIVESKDVMSTGIGETLFSDMVLWPESVEHWLFGSGQSIFYEGFHSKGHSDLGFFIQLNYGGIFFFTILMAYMLHIFRRLWKCGYKYMALFYICSFIVLNIKANFALRQGGILGFYLLIYYFLVYVKSKPRNLYQIRI